MMEGLNTKPRTGDLLKFDVLRQAQDIIEQEADALQRLAQNLSLIHI